MKRISLIVCILLTASQLQAGFKLKPGFVKVELTAAQDVISPMPVADLLAKFGGEEVADYGAFHIVYLPKGMLVAFENSAKAGGLRVRERDELDRIDTPGASVDSLDGVHGNAGNLIRSYPAARRGLYLLQLMGPIKAEWSAALRDLGWTVVGYLPSDAYILAGKPSLVAATTALPFVQFLDFYHPFERAAIIAHDTEPHDVIVEVSPVDDRQPTIDAITRLSLVPVRVDSYLNDVYVHARLNATNATELLSDPLVIGIGSEPVIGLSDERVALSLTTNISTNGSQPTSPAGYATWLNGQCPLCTAANMPAASWRVGIVDSGLDFGSTATAHADLTGREFWGGVFVSPNDLCGTCDMFTHGTLVAGIIAGNAASGLADSEGYFDGQGIAPAAGIFSTKISTFRTVGGISTGDIFGWATDATANGVTIQNHSHNDYNTLPSTAGLYTLESRQYDLATRDSDNNSGNGNSPIFFTVSAGNTDQGDQNQPAPGRNQVMPPATAKNVLAVGASENYRPTLAFADGRPCHGAFADDFRNIFSNSRRGTAITGYIKPDLVTPATIVVSTRTTTSPTTPRFSDCYDNFDDNWNYTAESGTSFAAPVAAGAAILLKRFYGSAPGDTSPALVKAALIAGSRSISTGTDHWDGVTVGPLPNVRQGFGRLTLERLFSQPTVKFDQASDRRFTTSGATWTTRLTVSDSSKPVTVALAWSDAAASAGATNPLVNDLDMSISPVATPCQTMQGNTLDNGTNGETSHLFTCGDTAIVPDSVNNVEYARFYTTGFTQFDIKVTAHAIGGKADLSLSTNNQDFALVAMNASTVASVPPQLTAHRNASNPFAIDLNWTAPVSFTVDHYTVNRGSTVSNVNTLLTTTTNGTTVSYTDSSLPSAINTWVYTVTAWSASSASITSNVDYATTVRFTNDSVTNTFGPVTSATQIQEQHITELRTAINSILVAGGHSAATWTDPSVHGVVVKHEHINELRSNLAIAVGSPFSFTPVPYTFPSLSVQQLSAGQPIHKEDINELRNNIK